MRIALSEKSKQSENLDLEERIGDPGNVMLWAVTCGHKSFQMSNKQRHSLDMKA